MCESGRGTAKTYLMARRYRESDGTERLGRGGDGRTCRKGTKKGDCSVAEQLLYKELKRDTPS